MNIHLKKIIVSIFSGIVGCHFLLSSVGKALDYGGFVFYLSKFRLPGLVLISPIIVILEMLVFLLLLLSINKKLASAVAIILSIVYLLLGQISSFIFRVDAFEYYGIFSSIFAFIGIFGVSLLQTVLLSMSIYLFKSFSTFKTEFKIWNYYITSGVFILVAYLMGFTFNNRIDFSYNKSPKVYDFRGEDIVNTPFKNYGKTLKNKNISMIFCFDYSCQYFWNSIENLKQYNKSKIIDTILLIGTDSQNKRHHCEELFDITFLSDYVESNAFSEVLRNSPCTYVVINDTIKFQIPGTLWAYQSFEYLIKAK